MASLDLRPYREGDAEALRRLWIASWNATLPEIDFAERSAWFTGWLSDHLALGAVLVCAIEEDGNILGFAGVDPGTGEMEQLAVAPGEFGTGVGQTLLDAAKAICPGGLTLRVNRDNPRAVAFYRRAGFKVTGEAVNPGGERCIFDMAWLP